MCGCLPLFLELLSLPRPSPLRLTLGVVVSQTGGDRERAAGWGLTQLMRSAELLLKPRRSSVPVSSSCPRQLFALCCYVCRHCTHTLIHPTLHVYFCFKVDICYLFFTNNLFLTYLCASLSLLSWLLGQNMTLHGKPPLLLWYFICTLPSRFILFIPVPAKIPILHFSSVFGTQRSKVGIKMGSEFHTEYCWKACMHI